MKDKRAFAEDCARADILVSRHQAPPGCEALVVIDRRYLAEHGATAIRLTPGWPRIVTVREPGQDPSWRAILQNHAPPTPDEPKSDDAHQPAPIGPDAPSEPLQ